MIKYNITDEINKTKIKNLIQTESLKFDKDSVTNKCINQQAILTKLKNDDASYIQLAAMIYRLGVVEKTITKNLIHSYKPFASEEDYFAIFLAVVVKCVQEYDSSIGNFNNFFNKMLHIELLNAKKNSFMKINSNGKKTAKEIIAEKGALQITPIETVSISVKECNYTEQDIMNEQLKKEIMKIPNGNLLLYKFFSDDKPISDEKIAKKYNMSTDQVRYAIKKASNEFRTKFPYYFNDYFYDTDNIGEFEVMSVDCIA